MSQIRQHDPLRAILLLLVVFSLAGCGSPSGSSSFNPDSGRHPAGWLPSGHKTGAVTGLESCTQCHGADYAGGISRISCTSCHIGNQNSIHPTQWGPFGFILHAGYVNTNTNSTCANALCHGVQLNGAGGTGPSCTSCHMGGVSSIHPPWGTPAYAKHGSYVSSKGNNTSGCANALCHGVQLNGAGGTGPSCTSCHMGGVSSIHPPWGTPAYAKHGSYVSSNGNNTSGCANLTCHGTTLTGVSGSGPSCSSCHLGGIASIHPPWGTLAYALHGTYVKRNSSGTSGCANATCHGTTLTGVSRSGPSCTLCHMGGAASVHPAEWNGNTLLHKTKVGYTNIESCKNIVCHGAALEGVYLSGPSCYICH